jgi:hypothetical protein
VGIALTHSLAAYFYPFPMLFCCISILFPALFRTMLLLAEDKPLGAGGDAVVDWSGGVLAS